VRLIPLGTHPGARAFSYALAASTGARAGELNPALIRAGLWTGALALGDGPARHAELYFKSCSGSMNGSLFAGKVCRPPEFVSQFRICSRLDPGPAPTTLDPVNVEDSP